MGTLRQRTRSAASWTLFAQVTSQLGQFISTAILARLIMPTEFGIVAMAYVFIGFLQIFGDLGIGAALIQRSELDDILVATCFWVNAIVGIILFLVVVIVAPIMSDLYQKPEVKNVLLVLSFNFPLVSVGLIQQALLEKKMNFRFIAISDIVASVFSVATAVVLAILGWGVWSLVARILVFSFLKSSMMLSKVSFNKLLFFSLERLKIIRDFSLNLSGFNLVNYFARNADNFLIGRYLGAQELGYYNLAYQLMLYPLTYVTGLLSRVLYPAIVKFKDDVSKFKDIYLQANKTIAFVTFPMMMGLFVEADHFILGIFGSKWENAISLLRILAWVGLFQSLASLVGTVYQSMDRTGTMFRWSLFASTVAVISFVIGLRWGVTGVASCYAIVAFILFFPGMLIPLNIIKLSFWTLARNVWRIFFCSILMVLVLYTIREVLEVYLNPVIILTLIIETLFGILSYFTFSILINKRQFDEIVMVLPEKFQKLVSRVSSK